jgi:hypothetical protein
MIFKCLGLRVPFPWRIWEMNDLRPIMCQSLYQRLFHLLAHGSLKKLWKGQIVQPIYWGGN